jgi:hypothetical protein
MRHRPATGHVKLKWITHFKHVCIYKTFFAQIRLNECMYSGEVVTIRINRHYPFPKLFGGFQCGLLCESYRTNSTLGRTGQYLYKQSIKYVCLMKINNFSVVFYTFSWNTNKNLNLRNVMSAVRMDIQKYICILNNNKKLISRPVL